MRLRQIGLTLATGAFFVICAVPASAPNRPYTFFTVDIPGSLSTTVFGLNGNRDIVGTYETAFPPEFGLPPEFKWSHGFTLRNGTLTRIDAPQAIFTQIRGINDQGDVVGQYIPVQNVGAPGGGFHGLVIKKGGALTTFDFNPKHLNTNLIRITSNGTMVGCYHDDGIDSGPQDSMHGIHVTPAGVMIAIDDEVPGVQFGGGMYTGTTTDGEKKTGFWWDHTLDRSRGFEVLDGKFVPFDVPGSLYTQAWDMNTSGDVVGMYGYGDVVADPNLHAHGFLKSSDTYQSIEYPFAIDTKAFGLNAALDIAGSYQSGDGHTHGFIAILQPYIQSDPGNPASAFKLPANMWGAKKVLAALKPIDKSTPLAKSTGQAPACHQAPVNRTPGKALVASLATMRGF